MIQESYYLIKLDSSIYQKRIVQSAPNANFLGHLVLVYYPSCFIYLLYPLEHLIKFTNIRLNLKVDK